MRVQWKFRNKFNCKDILKVGLLLNHRPLRVPWILERSALWATLLRFCWMKSNFFVIYLETEFIFWVNNKVWKMCLVLRNHVCFVDRAQNGTIFLFSKLTKKSLRMSFPSHPLFILFFGYELFLFFLDYHSWICNHLWRWVTARGSCTRLVTAGSAKV